MDEAEKSFTQGVNPEQSNDPNIKFAQKSDLQRNIDAIFGGAQKVAIGVAGDVAAGAVPVPGKLQDIWDRAKRKGWSLTPLDER
jgi:hypothetical protein